MREDADEEPKGSRPEAWAITTHWTVVLAAGQEGSPEGAAALEKLCRAYWYPLYAYARSCGQGVEDAQDLTQGFFLHLLENHGLGKANPARGKFRTFLLSAFNNFRANAWRRAHAVKRGGGQSFLSLDGDVAETRYALDLASNLTPEVIYERQWALTLLDAAMNRLEVECRVAGKTPQFQGLKEFLTGAPEEHHYGPVAARLGMTLGAVATAVHRLRKRYHDLVREEIAQTVTRTEEVEDEIRWLLSTVS